MADRTGILVLSFLLMSQLAGEVYGKTLWTMTSQSRIELDDLDESKGDSETVDLSPLFADNDMSYDVIDMGSLRPEDIVTSCHAGVCQICVKMHYNACIIAEVQHTGFMLEATLNGHVLFKKVIDAAKIPPICLPSIPAITSIADICIILDNVDIKDLSACVSIEFKIRLLHKKIHFKIGCFHIPHADEMVMIENGNKMSKPELAWEQVQFQSNSDQ